jgi:Domain of unknown function (DUF4845)
MNRLVKQRGFFTISGLIILVVIIFFLNCAFRLGPFYIDNISVRGALNSLAKDPTLPTMTKSDIRRKLNSYFDMNNVNSKALEAVSVEETLKTTFVNINYEERVNIIFNIDAVVVFKNQLDIKAPDLCCDPK